MNLQNYGKRESLSREIDKNLAMMRQKGRDPVVSTISSSLRDRSKASKRSNSGAALSKKRAVTARPKKLATKVPSRKRTSSREPEYNPVRNSLSPALMNLKVD